ncbi:hypothetical protein DFH28DRAFT_862881, partial [Melampsora americana]
DVQFIAKVERIWAVGSQNPEQSKMEVRRCQVRDISEFYRMREIEVTQQCLWINPREIEGVLNVQHNCHKSQCTVKKTRPIMIERRVSKNFEQMVVHEESNSFVLNSGSFYSSELHRKWARISFRKVLPDDWRSGIKRGMENWDTTLKDKKDKQ